MSTVLTTLSVICQYGRAEIVLSMLEVNILSASKKTGVSSDSLRLLGAFYMFFMFLG